MTDEEVGRLAESYARKLAKQWGGRVESGDLVASCWKGITKAMAAGISPGTSMWVKAKFQAIDDQRAETGSRSRGDRGGTGRFLVSRATKSVGNFRVLARLAVCPDPSDERQRLTDLWTETKAARSVGKLKDRVFLYLYAVEGWKLREIGEAAGVAERFVCTCLKRLRTTIEAHRGANQ
jgi:DNA-directed RNA polymerase specialized sigma24 family protein